MRVFWANQEREMQYVKSEAIYKERNESKEAGVSNLRQEPKKTYLDAVRLETHLKTESSKDVGGREFQPEGETGS